MWGMKERFPPTQIRSWLWAMLAAVLTAAALCKDEGFDFIFCGHLAVSVGISGCHS